MPVIRKILAHERFHAKHNWLSTYHLFSFADYYDPANMNFGVLRVFNDDTIDAYSGFGAHSHRDMEIVTIVLEGELTHKDSMGNVGTIKAGEVQYMSAGSGVTHAEMNEADKPVHLYQLWIQPGQNGLTPLYEQKDFSQNSNKNILMPVVSGSSLDEALVIRADVTIYTSVLDAGKSLLYSLSKKRGVYIYVYTGELAINDIVCRPGDQACIEGVEDLVITAATTAEFVLIDTLL